MTKTIPNIIGKHIEAVDVAQPHHPKDNTQPYTDYGNKSMCDVVNYSTVTDKRKLKQRQTMTCIPTWIYWMHSMHHNEQFTYSNSMCIAWCTYIYVMDAVKTPKKCKKSMNGNNIDAHPFQVALKWLQILYLALVRSNMWQLTIVSITNNVLIYLLKRIFHL